MPKNTSRRKVVNGVSMSRREYDRLYGRFAKTAVKSPEALAKARKAAGIPTGPAKGHKGRPTVRTIKGGWHTVKLDADKDWLTYIQTVVPENSDVLVNAYGVRYDEHYRANATRKVRWFNILERARQSDAFKRLQSYAGNPEDYPESEVESIEKLSIAFKLR